MVIGMNGNVLFRIGAISALAALAAPTTSQEVTRFSPTVGMTEAVNLSALSRQFMAQTPYTVNFDADALLKQSTSSTPRSVGEGLSAIEQALAGKYLDKKLSGQEDAARTRAGETLAALLSGNSMGGGFAPYGQPDQTPSPGRPGVGEALDRVSPQYTVPPELFAAVMKQESGGNPLAVSSKGAVGTMQTMPTTLTDPGYGVQPASDPTNSAEQERVGKDYLSAMFQRYNGDVKRTLVAYNWGPGNADKWDGNLGSLPAETRNYVKSIMGGSQNGKA